MSNQNADLLNIMRSRQSIRSYDASFKIPREEMKAIINEASLAPSSSNLQPWRFLVIDAQEQKEKLFPIAFNQKQVLEASAVIAVLGDMEAYKKADLIYDRAVEAGMPKDHRDSYVPRLKQTYANFNPEKARSVVQIDGGLVSMQLMLAAKGRGYDTVAMGGYSEEQFIEAFNIPAHYVPIMLIAIGKAAGEGFPKSRLTADEITFWNELAN